MPSARSSTSLNSTGFHEGLKADDMEGSYRVSSLSMSLRQESYRGLDSSEERQPMSSYSSLPSTSSASRPMSSLARAAGGVKKKAVVETTFVVGGGGGKKSTDGKRRGGTTTSYEVPFSGNSSLSSIEYTPGNNSVRRNSWNKGGRGRGSYRSRGSSTQKSPYMVGAAFVVGGENSTKESQTSSSMDLDHVYGAPRAVTASGPTYVVGGAKAMENKPQENNTVEKMVEVEDEKKEITVEKMEGVEDHGEKTPLVVLDGANVAYAYANAMKTIDPSDNDGEKKEPDARGVQVACKYFMEANVRVLVVVPQPWLRAKPREGDQSKENALMLTPQLEVLQGLHEKGLIVAAPPRDDDDAYAITIARRENARAQKRDGAGPGYVLSNDMFRDAMDRDSEGNLRSWLTKGNDASQDGPGRISFAFCDMGNMDDHGERELDIVPNPRHPLVLMIEKHHNES